MATEQMNIFLSASIPLPERDPKYIGTADVIAIRDSVLALASVVLPQFRLVWGGHPSITPLIAQVLHHFDKEANNHVTLYQSLHFERYFPLENESVAHIVKTQDMGSREESLLEMRTQMIRDNQFVAGFFIGGMEGVEEEYKMFTAYHPDSKLFPIASTGAAAKLIYDASPEQYDKRLVTELTYTSLFKELMEI